VGLLRVPGLSLLLGVKYLRQHPFWIQGSLMPSPLEAVEFFVLGLKAYSFGGGGVFRS
jgi:hypothetical protein